MNEIVDLSKLKNVNLDKTQVQHLEDALDDLSRELLGVQEMLYQVLKAVGEPVVVTDDQLKEGIEPGVQISIEYNEEEKAFVFGLVKDVEQPAEST